MSKCPTPGLIATALACLACLPSLLQATALAAQAPLPPVRLTPPVTQVAGLDQHTLNLDGEWLFLPETPVPFRGNVGSPDNWQRVTLPGYYALQGYDQKLKQQGESIAYGKHVDIPADWKDRVVVLRFGSLDGLSRVWINGTPVGSTDSAFMPVEFDITDQIKPGESNGIAVTLEWSPLTHWFEREMGGIGRSITLTALPKTNIARLHADTSLTDDGNGSVTALVNIDHRDATDQPVTLTLRVLDSGNNALAELTQEITPADAHTDHALTIRVDKPDAWTHERPRLYTLQATLSRDGQPLMTSARKFGFRTIDIQGPTLLFNGKPLKLQGTNYHLTHEGFGHFPPPELIRKDLEILRDMNMTILRSWPTPYEDYLENCDEIGMFTTVEVPMNLMIYAQGPRKDHGNDPSLETGVRLLAARMLEAYRSHPSILLWGVANESPYYPYYQRTAEWIREHDPARPVFFGSDNRLGIGIPGVQVNDDHYPRDGRTTWDNLGNIQGPGWDVPADRPIIFSEWCHIHVNNGNELNLDWGIDDHWGYMLEAHRRWADQSPQTLAGFIFKSAPYRGVGNKHPWRGLFEDDRTLNAYSWHTFKASSPLRLDKQSIDIDPRKDTTTFKLRNALSFTDLGEVAWEWTRGNEVGTLALTGQPGETISVTLPAAPTDEEPVVLKATSPRGFVLDTYSFENPAEPREQQPIPAPQVTEASDRFVIQHGPATYTLDRNTGQLTATAGNDVPALTAGPTLIARPAQTQFRRKLQGDISNFAKHWAASSVQRLPDHPAAFRIAGSYDHFAGSFTLRFERDGLHAAYDFALRDGDQPLDMFMVGLGFDTPGSFDTLTWERKPLWTYYPPDHIGRARGTAPALGDPQWRSQRDAAQPGDPVTWPWSQHLIDGVTRDFRSTRIHFLHAALTNAQGTRIAATSDGSQHFFASPQNPQNPSAGFTLHILDHYNGGSELHLKKSIRLSPLQLLANDQVKGEAVIRIDQP